MKRARSIAPPADPHRDLPDPNKIAARGYIRWRVFNYEDSTETEWPIIEVTDGVRKTFAWGEPIRCSWNREG